MPNDEPGGTTTGATSTTSAQPPKPPPKPSLRLPGIASLPLPPTGQLLWLGGLGALAAFEVIEWPVALVVAAATFVAEQRAKAASGPPTTPPIPS